MYISLNKSPIQELFCHLKPLIKQFINREETVCFITSEKRIHAWMTSIAQPLYFELGSTNRYNVIWHDHKEKSSIIHTEFVVSDSSIDTEGTGDDFFI